MKGFCLIKSRHVRGGSRRHRDEPLPALRLVAIKKELSDLMTLNSHVTSKDSPWAGCSATEGYGMGSWGGYLAGSQVISALKNHELPLFLNRIRTIELGYFPSKKGVPRLTNCYHPCHMVEYTISFFCPWPITDLPSPPLQVMRHLTTRGQNH